MCRGHAGTAGGLTWAFTHRVKARGFNASLTGATRSTTRFAALGVGRAGPQAGRLRLGPLLLDEKSTST